jgi:tripartite-type tricarboxylate transporter receptor subunit TctC
MRVVQLDMWMLALAICGVAQAQNPPSRPIRIVTVAPASANDIVARLIAHDFKTASGQPVIVDNRGTIAAELVAKAPPDGHTLLLYGSAVWISSFIFRNEATSVLNQLAPITLVASSPNVIVVHPSLPVKSARELIALAKRRPGELHYATGSLGAAPHLAAELFKAMAGVNVVRKSASPTPAWMQCSRRPKSSAESSNRRWRNGRK